MSGLGLGLRVNALRQGGAAPAFTPDSIVADGGNIFFSSALASTQTLYQDAGLTTEASATSDPVGGIKNLSLIGSLTITQPTTADKFERDANGRAKRGGVTTSRLLVSGTFDLAAGAVFGLTLVTDASDSVLFGGSARRFNIWRSSRRIAAAIGTSTASLVAAGLNDDGTRYRIIIAVGGGTWDIYQNGVLVGSGSTGVLQTVFSDICIGTDTITNTETQGLTSEAYLAANTNGKLDAATVAQIDAYMEALTA